MLLEEIGVDLFDRGAALERLARFVRVFGVRRPESANGLDVGGIERLDEIVGRRADRFFVGLLGRIVGDCRSWGTCCRLLGRPSGRLGGRLGGDKENLVD